MERILLFILDLFSGFYRFAGVNYQQVRTIVQVKLRMDGRRQTLMMGQQSSNQKGFFYALFIYTIFGLLTSLLIYALPSLMYSLVLIFSYIMLMVVMILITDFSSVLLDTSDNSILLPRPISSRTLLAARITHIVFYIGLLVLALSLGSIIAVAIKFSFTVLITFLVCIVLGVLFSVTLTHGLYLLIMRFTTEERLKNTINYLQIGMTIVFMGSYQLMPRMMGSLDEVELIFTFHWWTYLIPSVWLSATVEAVHQTIFDVPHVSMLLLSFIVPVGSLYVVSTYLAPTFASKLQNMGTETGLPSSSLTEKATKKSIWARLIESIVKNGGERSGFLLTQKMLARDRKLKLKIYPSIGYMFVIIIMLSVRHVSKSGNWLDDLASSQAYFFIIYFATLVLHTIMFEISYSDDFKAGWVFFSSPIQQPGHLLVGSLKAIITTLFLPIYFFVATLVLFIWGTSAIDDLLFGFTNNLVIILSLAIISKKYLPFSLPNGARNNGSNFARGILMVLVLGFLGFIHYGASQISGVVWVLTPLFATISYFMFRSYRSLTWLEFQKNS